jgi:hypothetical protein
MEPLTLILSPKGRGKRGAGIFSLSLEGRGWG